VKSSFVTQGQESLNPAAQDDSLAPVAPGGGLQPLSLPGSVQPTPARDADQLPVFQAPSSSAAEVPAMPAFDLSSGGSSGTSGAGRGWPTVMGNVARNVGAAALKPLLLALRVTCPECAHDSPHAKLYPITLATSFLWVAVLSTVIAAVVSRWGDLLGIPAAFLGMYVIAIGAEIPDTIQSVTVARRGYGSMAVSNSTGSQIINILIGLGLPWSISNMAGLTVPVPGVGILQVMGGFQMGNVAIYLSLLLLPTMQTWRPGDHSKASLGRKKGAALLVTYVVVLAICAPILLAVAAAASSSGE
jgi:Ca2+/Na+ antiporter